MDTPKVLDFRSDTVTRPTRAMFHAMTASPLGDDVLGDDPTVKKLEAEAARIFGKQTALYVPSGTMGNLIAIGAQAGPGTEIIMEALAHSYNFEAAGVTRLWGVQPHPILGTRGAMDPADVAAAVRPDNMHIPPTSMITIENTHNFHGGAVIPIENIRAISEIAKENGLALHMDGARIMNASVASGVEPAEYAKYADTVQFCLSKGLGAPVGSVVVMPGKLEAKARRLRKMLGGAMRQAGVIAGAGLVGLTEMVGRLKDDHTNAKKLAHGLAGISGVVIDVRNVETNIVVFKLEDGFPGHAEVMERLGKAGLLITSMAGIKLRMVTHKDVDEADVKSALAILAEEIPKMRK